MLTCLKAKMASKRGATISMALLLFLVCTIVASIAIAAGSAAAGRLSRVKKMDKSYYKVTSAAKLFKDELDALGGVTVSFGYDAEVADDGSVTKTNYYLKVDDTDITLDSSTALATAPEALVVDYVFGTNAKSLDNPSVTVTGTAFDTVLNNAATDPDNFVALGENIKTEYNTFDITSEDSRINTVRVKAVRNESNEVTFYFSEIDPNANKEDPQSFSTTLTVSIEMPPPYEVNPAPEDPIVDGRREYRMNVDLHVKSLKVGGEQS